MSNAQNTSPQLVTWPYQAGQLMHMAAYAGVFAATTYLIGTPLALGFAGVWAACDWYKHSNDGNGLAQKLATRLYLDVTSQDYQSLKGIVSDLSSKAHLKEAPLVMVYKDDGYENIAVCGNPPVLMAYKPYLKILQPKEIFAVVGHELTHIAAGHLKWKRAASIVANLAVNVASWRFGADILSGHFSHSIGAGLLASAAMLVNTAINISCTKLQENQADRGSVLLTREPQALASGLQKLMAEKLGKNETETGNSVFRAMGAVNNYFMKSFHGNRPAKILQVARQQHIPC